MTLTKNNIRDIKINLPLPFLSNVILVCLMLSVSFVARAGSEQEIGEPVVPSTVKGRHVDSAFMAPDGKHFYTLYEGLLSKFSMNPFQKVTSTKIDFKEILSSKNFFKVFITSDEKKLLISNSRKAQIALVDIASGRTIKTIKIAVTYSTVYSQDYNREVNSSSMMIDSVLNNNEFLVIKNKKLLIFNANTLVKLKEVAFDWRAMEQRSSIHNIFNKLIYIGVSDVGQILGNDYLQWSLYMRRNLSKGSNCWSKGISEALITFDVNNIKGGTVRSFNICSYPAANDSSFIDKRTIELSFGPVSTAGHYVVSGYRYSLQNLKTTKKYKIIHFTDGEVILFDTSPENNFILTSKARKHLKMKNATGEIVPINNATFEKYKILKP